MFKELTYEELLDIDAGKVKKNSWLQIIGEGILTTGSVIAGGPVPAFIKITKGVVSIMDEL